MSKGAMNIISYENMEEYVLLKTDGPIIKILFLADDIVRIRCSFSDEFEKDASYSLVMTAWEDKFDTLLKNERVRVDLKKYTLTEDEKQIIIFNEKIKILIYKKVFGIDIFDNNGNLLHSDLRGRSFCTDRLNRLYHYSKITENNYFYGFGEKTGLINKYRRVLRMSNTDTPSYDSEVTDPLYKHIPFYIKLDAETGIYSGMFYNNTYECSFDMGCERSGYWPRYNKYCVEGGEIDYFFIYGPDIKSVVRKYTDLTGKTCMLPKYSLGYLASTMYYTELKKNSDESILDFIDKAKKEKIKCDGYFMSSGYTSGEDGKRYTFNWNKNRFKNPKEFINDMQDKGVDVIPNIKPAMLLTHPLYNKFKEENVFVKSEDGKDAYVDMFWGGYGSFVDFTNPKARQLWKKYMKESLLDNGINCIWDDNNEYEINDGEAICDFEGQETIAASIRSVQPNLMARTAVEALMENNSDRRPYVMSRAGYAGIQRYAQTWSGDNKSDWKTLKYNIPVMLGMGLSGVANEGSDIGGFEGPAPEPELFLRWIQNGVFQPRFCIHSMNDDNTVTLPWMYPSYTEYIRKAIDLRYALVPYIYSLLYNASTKGDPIMRPLIYEFNDSNLYNESFDFMFGDYILVSSVLEKGQTKKKVYLPKGCKWYNLELIKKYEGGIEVELDIELSSIPLFIKEGAIIPYATSIENIHKDIVENLNILIDGEGSSEFSMYEDDGISNENLRGNYLLTTISTKRTKDELNIQFKNSGKYITRVKETCLNVLCYEKSPNTVYFDGQLVDMYLDFEKFSNSRTGWYFDMEKRTVLIKYNDLGKDNNIRLYFTVKNLMAVDF